MNLLAADFKHVLSDNQLDILRTHKIITSLDFVQFNNDRLVNMLSCNVSEIIKIKEKILDSNHSRAIGADRLYDSRLRNTSIIETGIPKSEIQVLCRVDHFLDGGFQSGTIAEIYGQSGSCKSSLALHLAAHNSLNHGRLIAYLTTQSPDVECLMRIMHNLCKDDSKNEASLKRIRFAHLSNVYQLMELLWAPDTTQFQIVIIDSLASLFGAILGDSSNDSISLLNKVASDLKRLAVMHRCAVLVFNHVSASRASPADGCSPVLISTPMPSLGRYWHSVPNLRLHIQKISNDGNLFELTAVRNVCGPINTKCSFSFPFT